MERLTAKLNDPHSHVSEHKMSLRNMEGGYKPKSLYEVGSLRGRPIITRQENIFDNHGMAIPILPYSDNIRRIHTRPSHR